MGDNKERETIAGKIQRTAPFTLDFKMGVRNKKCGNYTPIKYEIDSCGKICTNYLFFHKYL